MKFTKKRIIDISFVIVCILISIIAVIITVMDGKSFNSFRASIPKKSNLKRASEIDYKEYKGGEEDVPETYTVEWITNRVYEGFEPVTVFYEDIEAPEEVDDGRTFTRLEPIVTSYVKDLLKSDDVKMLGINMLDYCTAIFHYKDGDREYQVATFVTDETAEGKMTIFHSEVIRDETE